MAEFNGVKVFSATKAIEREALGENITQWMENNPDVVIADKVITQSSDNEFHCLTITFFFKGKQVWNFPDKPQKNGQQVPVQHQRRH